MTKQRKTWLLPALFTLAAACALLQQLQAQQPTDKSSQPKNQKTSPEVKDDDERILLSNSSKPPWKGDEPSKTKRPLKPPSSPRESLVNVGESELESFFDGQPLDPDQSTFIKILFRLPRFGLDNIERYARQTSETSWQDLIDDPKSHRIKMFHLKGTVTRVEPHDLVAEMAAIYEFKRYYRVTMVLDGSSIPVTVNSRRIPTAWKVGEAIDEPSGCFGLFLQVGQAAEGNVSAPLIFASHRMAWYPQRKIEEAEIGESHILLSKLGMDVALFDDVRPRNRKGVDAGDSECFYQLLAAMKHADQNDLLRRTSGTFELAPLLQDPRKQHGKLFAIEGNARQITKITIDQPYFRQRLGIDHYYEVDIFIPLNNQRVRIGKGDGPEFTEYFPVTVCVLRLPKGLEAAETMNESVRIPAFYFKLWAYKSEYARQFNDDARQLSPMLIGLQPQHIKVSRSTNPYIATTVILVIVLALGGIWFGLWRYGRGDEKFDEETVRRQFEVEKGKSLNDMGIESQDEPDFSGLE